VEDLKQRIFHIIQKPHLAALATMTEDDRPWVRYVTPRATEDLILRLATFVSARKVAHIKNNPYVHLTCGVTDPMNAKNYLQIQGKAQFTTDKVDREMCWFDRLENIFKGPDDPQYGVVIVKPYRIELWGMESFEPEVWEA